MRHLARHLVTLLSALSLLLAVAAAAMWARSYSVSDCLPRLVEANEAQIHSAHGRVIALSTREAHPKPGQVYEAYALFIGDHKVPLAGIGKPLRERLIEERGSLKSRQMVLRTRPAGLGNVFGFGFELWRVGGPWYVVVPYWSVVVLCLAWPAAVLTIRAARRRRRVRTACPSCGRPLPGGEDRCPNCGEAANRGAS